MRKEILGAAILALITTAVVPPLFSAEQYLTLGGWSLWSSLDRNRTRGVVVSKKAMDAPAPGTTEGYGASDKTGKVYETLVLSSSPPSRPVGDSRSASMTDLLLSFDQAGGFRDSANRYTLEPHPDVFQAGPRAARMGNGAASFPETPSGIRMKPEAGALFTAGSRLGDFSFEFWLYPSSLANGETLLKWDATLHPPDSRQRPLQSLSCYIEQNRVRWQFLDFFSSPDTRTRRAVSLSSRRSVPPRLWSHHLLRFSSDSGLLEYLIDGELESTAWVTDTGHEGGEVYLPLIGSDGFFTLAGRYSGLMDEFRLTGAFEQEAQTRRFPDEGGRVETKSLDMGTTNSRLLRLECRSLERNHAQIVFYVRASDEAYGFRKDDPWIPVRSGEALPDTVRGRYLQFAANLYPSQDGEFSPVLEEVRLVYAADMPPPPPSFVAAKALDNGGVELRWRASPDADVSGYVVYYGTRSGEYYGTEALLGASPVAIGKKTAVELDGLKEGRLYYFVVAACDAAGHVGEFSREVAARPIRME